MKNKIAFITPNLTDGGSQRVIALLANYFDQIGMEVSVFLVTKEKGRTYKINNHIQCIQNGTPCEGNSKLKKYIHDILSIRRFIKNSDVDTVISFIRQYNFRTILASLGLKKKVIVSERAFPLAKENKGYSRLLEKILYILPHRIVFQTQDVKSIYPLIIQRKSVVIPNPIDPTLPNPYVGEREKKIVAAGRLTEQKNFSILISAFEQIHKEYPNYRLIIYGEGPLLTQLQLQTRDLNIAKYVDFPGYVQDVDMMILDAAIYVSCSNYEGISNSMLEALAMGVPSICTDCPVGGAAMSISNGISGILIPIGDINALYIAMKKIIEQPEFASKLSLESRKIREEFSIERIGQQWVDLF